jgi:hypothetical protein
MKQTLIFFITIILASCNGLFSTEKNKSSCDEQLSTVKSTSVDLREGRLTYCISGESTPGWELEIEFDADNVFIKEKYARGAGRTYTFDKKAKEVLGLIDDVAIFGTEKESYLIYYTPQELIRQLSYYYDFGIIETQEFKEILGYKCQKFDISLGNQTTVVAWITDKIKTGIIYPFTPLGYKHVALEYELSVLGKLEKKYVINTIEDKTSSKNIFDHNVPDEYYMIVPNSEFDLDSIKSAKYEENTFKSFTYPCYGNNRDSTIKYFKTGLSSIVKVNSYNNISIDFFVNKDGTLSDIVASIKYNEKDARVKDIIAFVKKMNKWTPAKVKGKPVKSQVTISS